jgi:predicted amidohydrolase
MRVALWQTEFPAPGDTTTALERLAVAARDAAAQGAQWLITPEMALTGYAIAPQRLAECAEAADGPLAQAVAALAREHGVGIVYGWPERHPDGAKPYNAVQAISPQGERLAQHRKLHLFGATDAERFSPGASLATPFAWAGRAIGLLICYDVEQPTTVRALASQGANLLFVPTANMLPYDDAPRLTVPRLAAACGVTIVYANACGAEGRTHYGGLSTVAGPQGQIIAQAGRGPGLLLADLAP